MLILRHDVLDRVFVDGHTLPALVILETAQPVATSREVVEVAHGELAFELFVVWKSSVGGQQQEGCLNALQVPILLQTTTERGKGLVERVRRDGADRPAEYVGLDEADRLHEVVAREDAGGVVVIELQ